MSDDSSSALPDAALSRSLTRVSDSGLHPRPPPETLFYGETNSMNGRTAGPFLVLVVRSYPLSFWPQSISFLFSPTDLIIPKQKETRNCSSLEINEYTLL